jgi:translation initiation factor IF-2
MRVYELAKILDVSSKELLLILEKGNFEIASHMSVLGDDACAYLENHFKDKSVGADAKKKYAEDYDEKEVVAKKVEKPEKTKEPVVSKDVVSRIVDLDNDLEETSIQHQERIKNILQKSKIAHVAAGQGAQKPRRRRKRRPGESFQRKPLHREAVTEVNVEKSMPLHEVAYLFVKSSGDLIFVLLKKGMVCNRNSILDVDVIKLLGDHFGITVNLKKQEESDAGLKKEKVVSTGSVRWPVVVVMGHVDHGKTTLLDYVRKKNVAATEKGGITQHISAWEVDVTHGKIAFLDTPGHEAFSYMRERGSKVTDIAVLVVAADDGIQPQTIEAIKHAKAADVPIIVAVNKIDKLQSPAALETIKRQLSQHDLMPEEWGGQTMVIPISAKTGKGVDELLEMIVLQSQVMDLRADEKASSRAFVVESHVDKGFGAVATVICREGVLKQGDYFLCGNSSGKVRILINSYGKKIKQAGPSTPVQVVGFDNFSGIGDWLMVVPQNEYLQKRFQKSKEISRPASTTRTISLNNHVDNKNFINLIIKTDTRGSKEAVTGSIGKLSKTHKDIKCPIYITFSGVGDVSEGDIELASNTGAMIVGLHVKVEKKAQLLAKEKNVKLHTFQIIYQLVDYLEEVLISKKEIVKVWNKVGEAVVKKVFDIKGSGIIAGCYMRDGVLSRGNKVVCVRGGKELGEAKVVSLQRERKPVKEIHAGYECGFTGEGFEDWQEGDTVLCYVEKKEKTAK